MRLSVPAARRVAALVTVALLAACAGVPQWETPGATRAEVIGRLGSPTATYRLADGERLQYSQQPSGALVHNLDFDATGRLRRVEQALDPAVFARIEIGRWTREDLLRQFGPPALVERVARFDGDIWTWRYREAVSLQRSSGSRLLDQAAQQQIRTALFEPYREQGVAQAVFVLVPLHFELDEEPF